MIRAEMDPPARFGINVLADMREIVFALDSWILLRSDHLLPDDERRIKAARVALNTVLRHCAGAGYSSMDDDTELDDDWDDEAYDGVDLVAELDDDDDTEGD